MGNAVRAPFPGYVLSGVRLYWRKYKQGSTPLPAFNQRNIPYNGVSSSSNTADEYYEEPGLIISPANDGPGTFFIEFKICTVSSTNVEDYISAGGSSLIHQLRFKRLYPQPALTGQSVSNIGPTGAQLNIAANPNGNPTSVRFRYSLNQNLTNPVYTSYQPIGGGSSSQPVAALVSNLLPGTTYYYRAEAINAEGTSSVSGSGTFTTVSPIAIWRQTHFGTSSNNGSAADSADPNGNGVENLLEYALNRNPIQQTVL